MTFRTLDEIPSEELVGELSKRHYRLMSTGRCPYCNQPLINEDGSKWDFKSPVPSCKCRFGNVSNYHSPHVLQSLQYGD